MKKPAAAVWPLQVFSVAQGNRHNSYFQIDFKSRQIAHAIRNGSKNLLELIMAKKEYLP
jgi:hypothetical protein